MPATATATRARNKAIGNPIEHAIRTEKEYRAALEEVDGLLEIGPKKGSGAYNRLELLSILAKAYEDENDVLPDVTLQELVEIMAEQKGIDRTALAEIFGGRSRLSDFLNEKRKLSLGQIVRLKRALGIPADLLVG